MPEFLQSTSIFLQPSAVAVLAMAGAGGYMLFKYQASRLARRTQALESELKERLRELQAKNNQVLQQSELLALEKDRAEAINDTLNETLYQIKEQHKIIQDSNLKLTAGIRYATRIQKAILPAHRRFKNLFPDSFVFFRPRDLVSGDFYWMGERDNIVCLALADCTGHGVPGAFMSLIGHGHFNRAFNEYGLTDPGQMLSWLDQHMTSLLVRDDMGVEPADGMEVALLTFDLASRRMYFSGARRPIYIMRQGQLIEVKGSSYSVGGNRPISGSKNFPTHELELQDDDMVYMFSDGFVGQLGGETGTTFKSKRLKQILADVSPLPAEKQKVLLRQQLLEWMGKDYQQTDDVLVIGLRIGMD